MSYYNNWDKQSKFVIPSLKWYSVNGLVTYLHEIRNCIFDKKPLINKLITSCSSSVPASKRSRFPDTTSYMCEGIGDWNIHLDLLLYSINIMNNKSKRFIEESGGEFQTKGQVEIYAIQKINLLLQSIANNKDNLITRDRFEEMYELVWTNREIYFIFMGWKVMLDQDKNKIVSFVITGILQRVDKMWNTMVPPHSNK